MIEPSQIFFIDGCTLDGNFRYDQEHVGRYIMNLRTVTDSLCDVIYFLRLRFEVVAEYYSIESNENNVRLRIAQLK